MDNRELLLVAQARHLCASGKALELRLSAGLSIREVAEAIGVSPTAVWRWERGERAPRGAAAAAWAQLLRDLARQGSGVA
jgi:transcriptional regulator with XRE-family HTH domain